MSQVALILHVLFAAAWFGHKLLIPRDVRVSVRHPESAAFLIERMDRAKRLGMLTGLGTLATGVWLMDLTTGLTRARFEIYVALAAVLAMFLVGALYAGPAWNRIREAVDAEDTPGAVGGATAFNRALNLETLLWVLALTMMVV